MASQNLRLSRLLASLSSQPEPLALPLSWRGSFRSSVNITCLSPIRSGIGGTGVLQRNEIAEVVDLPGVGEHYMGRIQFSILQHYITLPRPQRGLSTIPR
jgi:hypothetical protein